ncbi:MAG: pyridoxal-dependent decarboxylase [Bacteroidetes bacterium]|nr:MAG: pyridoxal-dependent decarboxylase [Bacteroidota bacterium]
MTDRLKEAYDPEKFREQGHRIIDLLADHLAQIRTPAPSEKVFDWASPDALLERWQARADDPTGAAFATFAESVLKETTRLHHPNFMGHQTSVPAPPAALGELLGGFLDVGMGVYEQGNVGVVLERILIKKLATEMGMDAEKADGFFTSGGTLGNLTALLCARKVMAGEDIWREGMSGKQYAFIASEAAHYSIDRAVRVMGMGEKGLVLAPVNKAWQMETTCLEDCFERACREGIEVLGVVSSNCATAVGSNDSIDRIADFCEARNLWLHVDAAHGGLAIFSKKYRHLLQGIHRADSVIMDFHKMGMVPTLVTALIFKNGHHSFQTFAQKASYLWDDADSEEWYNLGKRTFELTKTTMSYRVYALWKMYGSAVFGQNVDSLYDLAQVLTEKLSARPRFEMPVARPESNIVCFRLVEKGYSEAFLDELNARIRTRLLERGRFFIVQTRLGGRLYLRVALMNPFTTPDRLDGLLDEVEQIAREEMPGNL